MIGARPFAAADLRSILRDPLLWMVLGGPLAVAVVIRVLLPFVQDLLQERLSSLETHRPTLVAFLLLMVVPMLFGMVSGLMILEDRESGVLRILQVSPVTLRGYLAWRTGTAMATTVGGLLVALPISGLLDVSLVRVLPAVALSALLAAVFALVFGAVAANRLEGLALLKGVTLLVFVPVLARYVSGPVETAFALLPTYWPSAVFWRAADSQSLGVLTAAGGLYLTLWVFGAARLLERRSYRSGRG